VPIDPPRSTIAAHAATAAPSDDPDNPAATPMPPRQQRTGVWSVGLRVAVGVLALSTLASVGAFGDVPPVSASRSCTGWTSKTVPPRTVRSGVSGHHHFRRGRAERTRAGQCGAVPGQDGLLDIRSLPMTMV